MGVMEKVHPSSTFRNQACQPGGDAPRWGFLSAARKEPKTTKGGAFPRLVESTPRYWVACQCSSGRAGHKKTLKIAAFLGLMGVGEGLAPPEFPRAMPG